MILTRMEPRKLSGGWEPAAMRSEDFRIFVDALKEHGPVPVFFLAAFSVLVAALAAGAPAIAASSAFFVIVVLYALYQRDREVRGTKNAELQAEKDFDRVRVIQREARRSGVDPGEFGAHQRTRKATK